MPVESHGSASIGTEQYASDETNDGAESNDSSARHDVGSDVPTERRVSYAGFLLSGVAFLLGSGVLLLSEVPGASTPVPWTVSNLLFFLAMAFLAVGTAAGVRRVPALRTSFAASLATGALALGVLQGFQWLSWKYVDVIAYDNGAHELLFDALLHPYGVAHAFGYAILLGSGVALLAWRFRHTGITHRFVDWGGILFGATTVSAALLALLSVVVVGDSQAFVAVVLQFPLLYLWAGLVGLGLYRRRGATGFGSA